METVMNKFEPLKNGFYRLLKMKYFGFISKSIALEATWSKLKRWLLNNFK
jgi:hypothetical protein